MGTFIVLVLGIVLGAVLGYFVAQSRAPGRRPGKPGGTPGSVYGREDLARAWQQGYDAGSTAAAAAPPVPTSTAPTQPAPVVSAPALAAPAPVTPAAPGPLSGEPVTAAPSTPASGPLPPVPPVPPGPPRPSTPPVVGHESASLPAPPPAAAGVPPHAGPWAPSPSSPPPPTPEERAAAKERRDQRNVNITLYTACLLLVAAASLFIGAALPVTARVVGLAVVVGLFYVGGLVVHAVSRTVRPAAVAFAGTGLALVPVFGVALDALVLQDPVASWLVTSALGTVMLAVAALRLDSTVIAFLSVPFLLSTVMASGAAVQQGMVWAFLAWIGLAVLMAWLAVDDAGRDRWLPGPYRQAVARTHQWIVPGSVLAAISLGLWVEPVQMFLLMLAACAYYATVAVIGPRRFRLASSYAVRAGLLLAVAAWAAMLDWSLSFTLTVLVACLCLQVPLTWFGRGRDGYLPAGPAAHVDRVCALVAAGALTAVVQAGALFGADGPWLMEGFSGALAVLVLTTAVLAVASVRATLDPAAGLGWQAATPLALVPAVLGWPALSGDEARPWLGETCLAVVIVVQLVIAAVLRRSVDSPADSPADTLADRPAGSPAGRSADSPAGRPARWDGLVAPHGAALATVGLVYLLVDRGEPAGGWTPALVAGLTALAWASVTAGAQRPAAGGASRVVPTVAWSAATLLALALLGGTDSSAAAGPLAPLIAGWYAVLVVTAGVGLWWLVRRGDGPAQPESPGHAERIAVLVVSGTVLVGALILLSTASWDWHGAIALAVLTAWLVATAVLSGDRLPRPVRAAILLAGQAGSALLVSDVVGLLGGDGSATRCAAAVALLAGLAVRSRLADRLAGLGPDLTSAWAVTAALGGLWLVESALGGDRAALMIVAATVIGAGLVLRVARGGHWTVLAGTLALVLPASSVVRLESGWLPAALVPTSVAAALLVLLALAVAGLEIAASVAGTREDDGRGTGRAGGGAPGWPAWVTDLAVFRPVAIAVLWSVAVLLGLVAGPERDPHPGVLGVTAAAAALLCYLFARTRGILGLAAGTVVAVPAAASLLLQWWRDRGLWAPEEAWQLLLIAVLSAGVLGLWARMDASARPSGTMLHRLGPAVLWQGGLAVALVLAAVSVLRVPLRAGMPQDAVAWAGCALVVAACWLAVEAGGRTLLWGGATRQDGGRASWLLNGRDVAVLVAYAAAARAWWQTAEPDHPGQALWWTVQALVVLLVAMGLWHGRRHGPGQGQEPGHGQRPVQQQVQEGRPDRRLGFHLAAATVFTLAVSYVLVDGTGLMQLTVLAGFGTLVVLGLVQRLQVLTWWGAAGVALSVLWYLREYTYVYLALLGAALIALAVWQLRRRGRTQRDLGQDSGRDGHDPGQGSERDSGHDPRRDFVRNTGHDPGHDPDPGREHVTR
ncbi:MAG: hypothetical protein QJR09_12375 [Micrococcus sp.]|nr:hypothetical protein [Micrococcus sp.]